MTLVVHVKYIFFLNYAHQKFSPSYFQSAANNQNVVFSSVLNHNNNIVEF